MNTHKKSPHTWMETLPFDVREQSNNFLIAITKNRRYDMWIHGYTDIDELEAKLFKQVSDEIEYRIEIGIWYEQTSSNISSVSTLPETANISLDRKGQDN